MARRETLSLSAVVVSHGAMHSYIVVLPALLPLMKEELGSYFILGLLASIVYLVYGWGSFPVGILADRFSKKKLIILSMMLCGLSSILISLSQGFISAAVSFMLLGVGTSLYHPVGYSLISLLSEERRGRYMGIQGLGGNVGMAVGYALSAVIGSFLGWRFTFLIWGIMGIVLSITNAVFVLEPRRAEKTKKNDAVKEKVTVKRDLKEAFNVRAFSLIILIVICSGALWSGVSSFILTYINEAKGVTLLLAGGLTTISYTVGSFAQLLGGELSDRLSRRTVFLVGFGLFSVALFSFTLPFRGGPLLITFFVSTLGFLFFITQPSLNAIIGDISSDRKRGVSYGINFMVKYGIGGVAPGIAGYLATYSMNLSFYFFALIAATAFLLCAVSPRLLQLGNLQGKQSLHR